jgi:hypothetical protein
MTISQVSNDDLLEEIRLLKATVESLSKQLSDLKLGKDSKIKEKLPNNEKKLVVGARVRVLTKAKYGKSGDFAVVTHIGKVFVSIKLESGGRTTTRLPENLKLA